MGKTCWKNENGETVFGVKQQDSKTEKQSTQTKVTKK
jgi:hypothetical protein